jgi:hypothetical protein
MINNILSISNSTNYSSSKSSLPTIPNNIPTKGMYKTTDSDFQKRVLELARQDVAKGVNSRGSKKWQQLSDYYVSSASPNRRGLVNSTLSGLSGKMRALQIKFSSSNFFKTLFANNHLFKSRDIGANFINFRDSSGEIVAAYDNTGWRYYSTPKEVAREHAFMKMWDEAILTAGQEQLNANTTIECIKNGVDIDLKHLQECGTAIDMDKLASYGITLDNKTGETHVDMEIFSRRI